MKNIINFLNVSIIRDKKYILKDITVNIKFGENVVLFGPNGSGKSTFLKLLTREIYPSYNANTSCRVCDKTVWEIEKLRHFMGIVSNDIQYNFNFNVTGFETVLSGFFGTFGIFKNHIVLPKMIKKAENIMKFLDIYDLKNKNMNILSAGENKKFLIARALVNEPKVLILDEPANNLDIAVRKKFKNILKKIIDNKTNVLYITHQISDIIPEMSRIIMFKKGEIFMDGHIKDILNSDNLSALFDTDVDLIKNKKGYFII